MNNGMWFFVEYAFTIVLYMLYPIYRKSLVKKGKPIDPNSTWKIALINSLVIGGIIIGAKYLLHTEPLFDTRPILFYVINSFYLKFEGKKAEFTLKEDPNEEDPQ